MRWRVGEADIFISEKILRLKQESFTINFYVH